MGMERDATGRSARLTDLSLTVKFLYGVGDIANSVRAVLLGLFVFFFYTSVMGLPGTLVGLASGVGLIVDALLDPYIGYVSDRVRPRLGRRHSFMLLGSAAIGLSTWMLFSPPRGMSTAAVFGWFCAALLLTRVAGAVFQIPYYALGAELAGDYDARTELTGIRGLCSLVGSVAAASLSFVLFFPNVVPGEDPKLNYDGYPAMGLTLGLAMTGTALVATLSTLPLRARLRERSWSADQLLPGPGQFATGAVTAFRSASFRALFCSFALIYLGTVVNAAFSIHFFTYYAGIVDSGDLSLVRAAFYGGAMLAIPLWLRLSRTVEKRWLYLAAAITTAGAMAAAFVLVGHGRPFGTGDVRVLVAGQVVAGLAASVFWIIPPSMLADVTDEDALVTGAHRPGIFFGMVVFGQKLVTGLSVLLAGALIDGFAGLVPGQATQSAVTTERIGILFSLVPAGLLIVGACAILAYGLSRERVAAVQQDLARLTDAGVPQPDALGGAPALQRP
jgi:glycoside/pentoside/hexuronide:cation symporter, GPH family